jgi:hypothetical protein
MKAKQAGWEIGTTDLKTDVWNTDHFMYELLIGQINKIKT